MAKKPTTEPTKAPTTAQVIKQIDKARRSIELAALHRATDGKEGKPLPSAPEPGESPG